MDGDYNKPLSNFERIYIKNCLIRGNFIDTYLEEQKKIYENVKGYLLQEIPKSGEVAFVDLQGTGKSQKCMKMFFEKIGYSMHIPVTAFYYAFYPLNMVQRSENIFFTYSNKIFPIPGILEVLARAPHGQTIDYKYKCGKWIPVFSDVCDYPDSESFQDYKNGIVDYVKNLDEANLLQTDNYRKLADRLLFKLGTYPDVEMQNFIGEMQFESDFDGNIKRFAPKLNDTDIKKIYKNGFCDTKDYNGCSFAFSSLRMSEKQRLLIAKSKKIYAQNTEIDKKENNVLKLEKKLIIYGMGKRGLVLYNELSKRNDIEIVLLVDKNYISKDSQNLNVSSVEKILETEFDYIVISVVNETVKKEILNNLLKLGIQREVILI